jgi:hypothetical protein
VNKYVLKDELAGEGGNREIEVFKTQGRDAEHLAYKSGYGRGRKNGKLESKSDKWPGWLRNKPRPENAPFPRKLSLKPTRMLSPIAAIEAIPIRLIM